jgi:hypothetical protein
VPEAATSLELVGKGSPYYNNTTSWGNAWINNIVHTTEHFSHTVPPIAPLVGQIWFDQNANTHRAFNTNASTYDIVDVVTGGLGSFSILGDETLNPLLQPGETIVVYNNVGMGIESQAFTVTALNFALGETAISVAEPISANADASGILYALKSWQGIVTAGVPVTDFIDMDGYKIINLGDATDPTDALNMQTGDARYVNVTGDTMTGDLTLSASDLIVDSGTIQLNNASNITFPVGTTIYYYRVLTP